MTVGDFANADPAPAPLYAREVKATMAEAGLPAEAERRFPVRIRIGIPRDGLGSRLDRIRVWLDANCGANGWAMTAFLHWFAASARKIRSVEPRFRGIRLP